MDQEVNNAQISCRSFYVAGKEFKTNYVRDLFVLLTIYRMGPHTFKVI
jgi:hypothetical protein